MKTLAKLPVTIVTGFLGSGKTTLLRHMLDNAQGRRIAVIVNEFGELGIDGEILKQCSIGCSEEEANGRVYELANGCLCCTVQEEFFPVMRELVARRGDLDHILIETSGLALPKPLVQAFQWPEIRTACTVDAQFTELVDDHRDAAALGVVEHMAQQGGLARAEEAGNDGDGELGQCFHVAMPLAAMARACRTTATTPVGLAVSPPDHPARLKVENVARQVSWLAPPAVKASGMAPSRACAVAVPNPSVPTVAGAAAACTAFPS